MLLEVLSVAAGVVPPQLYPIPEGAVEQCRRMQAGVDFPVLCPARLPRPTRGWSGRDPLPRFRTAVFGSQGRPKLKTPYGMEFAYGAPVEPLSGHGWRHLVWHNRPCCSLHFTIFVPRGSALPARLKPATLGGKRGLIRSATGYGLAGPTYWWGNHTWFIWRQQGTRYAASLHFFGPGTTPLLGRLIRELQPARRLRK